MCAHARLRNYKARKVPCNFLGWVTFMGGNLVLNAGVGKKAEKTACVLNAWPLTLLRRISKNLDKPGSLCERLG